MQFQPMARRAGAAMPAALAQRVAFAPAIGLGIRLGIRLGIALGIALAVGLAGCAAPVEQHSRPIVPTPPAWVGQAEPQPARIERDWWKRFGSAQLDRLIAQAHSDNPDLHAAAARVAQARAKLQVERSARYPEVLLGVLSSRAKTPGESAGSNFAIAAQASYEVDLWGRRERTVSAFEAALAAGTYAQDAARIELDAAVAGSYLELLFVEDRLRVAQDSLAIATRLLQLVEGQHGAGRVSRLELERQRSQVAAAEAALPPLRLQRQLGRDLLATLLGQPASALEPIEGSLRELPYPAVAAAVPAALLERRPDIRRAEAELIAAHADLGAARAAVYPTPAISAEGALRSATLGRLLDFGFAAIGVELLATIFDAGRRAGAVDIAAARKAELVAAYRRSVLTAYREVEDALAGIRYLAEQERAQQQAAQSAAAAHRLAEARYRAGAVDFTTVLDTQRTLLAAEAALDPVRFARFGSLLALYRALGGGWEAAL